MKLIAPALAEIKMVFYPVEERLVSLEVLKLYRVEEVIRKNPKDIDPDRWLDKREFKELPEIPLEEVEVRVREPLEDWSGLELYPEPDLDIPLLPEDPEVIAVREGIHKRIQLEIQHEDKEGIE